MTLKMNETLERLFDHFVEDALKEVKPEERETYRAELEARAAELFKSAADGPASFSDLVGLGAKEIDFGGLAAPGIDVDFDESIMPTQIRAVSELYVIYQYEKMRVFDVAQVLLRLFRDGKMKVHLGPGARQLYLLEKHAPLRYKAADRQRAYRRVFNYGTAAPPAGAHINTGFHRQFVAFAAAIAQYYRDLLIGEVIRGSQNIGQRPFGSQATIQRLGTDLRWDIDRASYGNIVALTVETLNYVRLVMSACESPDIMKVFDASNKWDVIEEVSRRHLGGVNQLAQRASMADSGRSLLRFTAGTGLQIADPELFRTKIASLGPLAEKWIAAYRMTPEGASFPGVTPALQAMLGTGAVEARAQ